MPTPRSRRPFVRALTTALAVGALIFGSALPAHADPVVSEVPGGFFVASLAEYNGLLYLGSETGLQSFDGTTFTSIPGAPESPRDFVVFDNDLWMVGGPLTNAAAASLWRFDGTTITQYEAFGREPVAVGGTLFFSTVDPILSQWVLASTDGTATTVVPGSPSNVVRIARDPNGTIALVAGAQRTFWTFDGAAFAEVAQPGAPVDIDELYTLSGAIAFGGEATVGDPDAAYTWNGTALTRLGAATDVGCFVEDAGVLYYLGNGGTRRMFSATVGAALSEAPVTPEVPAGCPRYIGSDGTFYLQAEATPAANPTLHTWDGAMLTELSSGADYPVGFLEYGGKIYFSAQPISETPALFVLEDVTAAPTGPLLPSTGAEISWWLIAVAALLVGGGVGILAFRGRRRRT